MANFHKVNKILNKMYPDLDVIVIRGEGYVYFTGLDSERLNIESIMTHPVSTDTHALINMCISEINEGLKS